MAKLPGYLRYTEGMKPVTKDWIHRAIYDFESAKLLLHGRQYLHCVYFCQQTIEKALKAIITEHSTDPPPYTHNLVVLNEKLVHLFKVNAKQASLLNFLTKHYIPTRYPGYKEQLSKALDSKQTKLVVKQTQELYECLTKLI